MIPVFLLYMERWSHRIKFLISGAIVVFVCSCPYILQDPAIIYNRVAGYSSFPGQWGITQILALRPSWSLGPGAAYIANAKFYISVLVCVVAYSMNHLKPKPPLFAQCGLIAFLFLAMTPGFSVQYLAWLVPWVIWSPLWYAAAFYLTSGVYLFAIYTFWSKGLPWDFANGMGMPNSALPLGLLTWTLVVLYVPMTYIAMRRQRHHSSDGPVEPGNPASASDAPQAAPGENTDLTTGQRPPAIESRQALHDEEETTAGLQELTLSPIRFQVTFRWPFYTGIFAFCAAVLFWYITDGNGRFAEQQWFTSYYDGVADRLLQGRLDVPDADLDHEVFRHAGKTYGYFGPTPALPRMLLNKIFPRKRGNWSRTLIWFTALATLFLNAALLSYCRFSLNSPVALAYFVTAALGSTLMFATSWAITYMEALCWAAMLAIASVYSLLRYLRERRMHWLAAAGLAGGLSFFARNATGAGPLAALGLVTAALWLRPKMLDPRAKVEGKPIGRAESLVPHAALATALLLGCLVVFGAINYFKFGSVLESYPIRFHAFYKPEHLARINNTLIHPEDAPRRLFEYLFGGFGLRKSFPWVVFSNSNLIPIDWLLKPALYSGAEVHAGVLATMPAMFLLAIVGVSLGLRNEAFRAPLLVILLCPLVGVLLLATIAWISQRYVHEFYPFVAVSAPFGLRWFAEQSNHIRRAGGYLLLAVLMAWSIAINPLLALHWQREGATWGCTADCANQYKAMRDRVDRWTGVTR
jgi:hypothetical protein